MTETAADALERLERLIADVPEPYEMTLNMELYGRDQIDLAAYQDNCRAALRAVMAICRMVN